MKHYLLFLEFGETYEARRPEFRNAHLKKAWAAAERGELVLAGALTDPHDSGVIFFKGDSSEVVERFVKEDPYVNDGSSADGAFENGQLWSARIRPRQFCRTDERGL